MVKSEKIFPAIEFKNIKEIIYNSAEVYKEKIAFVIKHKVNDVVNYENITYQKLLEDVNKLGTALYNMKLKGKRIAIIGRNRYEWAIAHLANLLGGNVSVPLDKDLQYEEFESSLIRSKADCIIFDEKLVDKVDEIKKQNRTNLTEYICMKEIDGYSSVQGLVQKGGELIENGEREYIDYKIDENVMNILLFTSGTTSKSKAVMLSQKNIASNIYAMQCVEDIRNTDTNIAFLPFHHIFGSTCMIMMLACGVKTVFPDGLRYIKQNLNEYKVTLFVGVPVLIEAIYKTIMKEIEKQGKTKIIKMAIAISNVLLKLRIDVRRKLFKQIIDALGGELRFVISGGAPADAKIAKGFNDLGIKTVKDDVKLSVKIVYSKEVVKEKYSGIGKDELYQVIWNQIKELNKTFQRYKHIQKLILTDEELIKTTTKKVKRQEEMKKILAGSIK